jgi:hypothetical protein
MSRECAQFLAPMLWPERRRRTTARNFWTGSRCPRPKSNALGHAVSAPSAKVAPRPYKDTVQGTDCLYKSESGRQSAMFRIYFDPSLSQAKDLFGRLGAFFGEHTAAPGIGDDAYVDSQHALHARKGNVRFFIEVNGLGSSPSREKMVKSLGAAVAGRL